MDPWGHKTNWTSSVFASTVHNIILESKSTAKFTHGLTSYHCYEVQEIFLPTRGCWYDIVSNMVRSTIWSRCHIWPKLTILIIAKPSDWNIFQPNGHVTHVILHVVTSDSGVTTTFTYSIYNPSFSQNTSSHKNSINLTTITHPSSILSNEFPTSWMFLENIYAVIQGTKCWTKVSELRAIFQAAAGHN